MIHKIEQDNLEELTRRGYNLGVENSSRSQRSQQQQHTTEKSTMSRKRASTLNNKTKLRQALLKDERYLYIDYKNMERSKGQELGLQTK